MERGSLEPQHRLGRRGLLAAGLGGLGLLAGCAETDLEGGPASSGTASSAPGRSAPGSSAPSGPSTGAAPSASAPAAPALPVVPDLADPVAAAGHLDRAWRTVLDRRSTTAELRSAGEHWQRAVRLLAQRPVATRRRVIGRLAPDAAEAARADVLAALELGEIGSTPRRLPDAWRVVAPRPAEELLGYYREASRATGVDWTYLAAINLVETRMGRIRGTSTAGAQGPMQFLPTTWDIYGEGGDINDPRDAIHAAARLLRANGAPGDIADALWHYNPTEHYARAVSAHAGVMQRRPRAYHGYHQWQVLYRHVRGTYLLPVGYPRRRARLLPEG